MWNRRLGYKVNGPFRSSLHLQALGEGRGGEGSCARDLVYVIAWYMHHGTVLGDANKKPVMHCQRR